jgi:hypothetical protein
MACHLQAFFASSGSNFHTLTFLKKRQAILNNSLYVVVLQRNGCCIRYKGFQQF